MKKEGRKTTPDNLKIDRKRRIMILLGEKYNFGPNLYFQQLFELRKFYNLLWLLVVIIMEIFFKGDVL